MQSFKTFNFKSIFPIFEDFEEKIINNKLIYNLLLKEITDSESDYILCFNEPVKKPQKRPIYQPIIFIDIVDMDEFHENMNMWNVLNKMNIMHGDKNRYYENHNIAIHEIKEDCLTMSYKEVYNKWTLPQSKFDFIYLTARPSENMSLSQFQKINKKIFQKVFIKDFKVVYEQTGKNDTDVGKGFHIHAIINVIPSKDIAQANRELKNSYIKKNINIKSNLYIEDFRNDKTEYITGYTKNDSEKDLALPFDQKFRTINDLSLIISTIEEL